MKKIMSIVLGVLLIFILKGIAFAEDNICEEDAGQLKIIGFQHEQIVEELIVETAPGQYISTASEDIESDISETAKTTISEYSDTPAQELIDASGSPVSYTSATTDDSMNDAEAAIEDPVSENIDSDVENIIEKAAVILSAPKDFNVYQSSLNSVRMTWQPSDEFDFYELFRSINNSGRWTKVKNVYGGYGSNLNLEVGSIYSYKIRGVAYNNGVKECGLFSEVCSVGISDYAVTGLMVTQKNLTSVGISWKEQSEIKKYELYRSEDSVSWTRIKTSYSSSTTNLNLIPGKAYYYKVRAYVETPDGKFMGKFSDPVSIVMLGAVPQNLIVSKSSATTVRLEWDKVEGCDYYEVFRDVNNSGTWKKVKNVYGEVGSNLNLETGKIYSYKIRAVFINNGFTYVGGFSDPAVIDFIPTEIVIEAPVLQSAQQIGLNRVRLNWSEVENADYYILYRSVNEGKWERVKTSTETFVQNLSLREGVTYKYRITAVCQDSYGNHESNASNDLSFTLGQDFSQISDLNCNASTNNKVLLTWTYNDDSVQGYSLYRRVFDGAWSKVKNVSGFQTNNLNLNRGEIYSYYLRAYRISESGLYYSLPSNIVIYWNESISGVNISDGILSWNAIENADGYIILSDGQEFAMIDNGTEFVLTDELIGCTMQVIAYQYFEDKRAESSLSEGIVYEQNDNTKFRALLIGETAYSTRLNGPDNDISFMKSMLNGMKNGYDVISQQDATLDEIVNLIDFAFDGATDDDISLFYYSGHGVTGAGEYYSGALQTVDYQYLTTGDLAGLLSAVPGRVIVILDSCGSGAAITDGTDMAQSVQSADSQQQSIVGIESSSEDMSALSFDAEQFNCGVINAFSSVDSPIGEGSGGSSSPGGPQKAGEMKQTKFFVITGSAYEEKSLTTMIDGVWGGVMTRGIAFGTGYSYPEGVYSGTMPADTNGDDGISFSELAAYCKNYAGDRQNVLSYSASPIMLFSHDDI